MNKKPVTREELFALGREYLRDWRPSETTIDGGIFPSRIGDDLFAYTYDEKQRNSTIVEFTDEQLASEPPIGEKRPLPPRRR